MFAASVGAFILHYIIGGALPWLASFFATMSLVSCGLAWLLAQALFHDMNDPHVRFRRSCSVVLVGVLFVLTLVSSGVTPANESGIQAYLGLLQSLLGSAVLLMTLLETFDRFNQFNWAERRFRIMFATGYGAILGSSFIVRLPEFLAIQTETQVGLSIVAVIGAGLAVRRRLRHPLAEKSRKRDRAETADADPVIAREIELLLHDDSIYLDPDIRLADLAQRLRKPEYKVSRCITHDLSYRNFNHMINVQRIEAVKRCFNDPASDRLPILSLALDCGFASIGPFNRAFKLQTGETPSAFRRKIANSRLTD